MKKITREQLLKDYEIIYGEDSRRLIRAVPKSVGLPRGLILNLDTTKVGFQRIVADIFFIPQVINLYVVGWGQNVFIEIPDGVPFSAITHEIDKLVPERIRSKVKYPKVVDCCAELPYWKFPNTFLFQKTEEFLEYLQTDLLKKIAPGDSLSAYNNTYEYQTAYSQGEAIALVYSNPYDVSVSWILQDTEKMYQFGVDSKTHEITLKEV